LKHKQRKDDAGEPIVESLEDKPSAGETPPAAEEAPAAGVPREVQELNDKYLRLYAEFDNYRKRVSREKEELLKFGNESLLYDLLPVLDSLELALKHRSDPNTGLLQGVEITLKEFQRVLEKFGVKRIEAEGKAFDPSVHHAMVQVEREDLEEKMIAEELRAGYLYRDKVLRPSLVAVSVKPPPPKEDEMAEGGIAENSYSEIKRNIEEEQ
jgi:molecular chaperone GrpE